jgi:cellulose synthase/poly-beta-1,6-N-acetylglucosamine synthase-like glycosyltransferase
MTIWLSKLLLGWLVTQISLAFVCLWCMRYLRRAKPSHRQQLLPDDELPKAAVILCLRGADPFLADCLRALLNQDYPQYDLKLVIDRQEDPAWKIANDIIKAQGATNVDVNSLRFIRQDCSLKCSSLLQAILELDKSYQVVALVDADTVVHPSWLRELVSPLANPKVGATTGNRWYLPKGRYWGSWVRYIWNISAFVQMYLCKIPWGGSLAIKTDLLQPTGLLDKWGQAFHEDIIIASILRQHRLQVKFVPSAIALNREECNLLGVKSWLQRQLLSLRLDHPCWLVIYTGAIFTTLLPNIVILTALYSRQWQTVVFALGCYAAYILTLLSIVLIFEQEIQKILQRHPQPITKLSASKIGKLLLAIPLTQWVYGWAMLSSLWMSTVSWRAITYRVTRTGKIRLLEYRPYRFSDQPSDRNLSL